MPGIFECQKVAVAVNRPFENGPRPVGISGYRIRATGYVKSRHRNTCQAFRSPQTVVHTPGTNCHPCLDASIEIVPEFRIAFGMLCKQAVWRG